MAGDDIVTSAQFLIDSESSKSSDFKRMTTTLAWQATTLANEAVSVEAVWVEATVKNVHASALDGYAGAR